MDKNVWGENSLIEKVLNSRQSIVDIKAVQTKIVNPKAHVTIDPRTGKILVAKRAQRARFEKKGAGVIVHSSGAIVTNFHTIKFAHHVYVRLYNDKIFEAKIVHLLPEQDLALLKISSQTPLHPIEFANSDSVKAKDEVIHVGTSQYLKDTISGGIVTGLRTRTVSSGKIVELIQVNINLYHGDSGGPLLNHRGQLIGMMVAKNLKKERISFAIPSNKIQLLLLDLVR